ncbi:hypothetical protein K8R47_02895 [archaeon]|nr:hypothetical protein [archaeon]
MFKKKAQTAMEYLMTYGWAILIVLIALAALFYLGVFNPSTPNVCTMPAPFTCIDTQVLADDSGQVIVGTSGLSGTSTISATGDCSVDALPAGNNELSNGENIVLITCTGVAEGDKVSGTLSATYTLSGSSIQHTASGTYSATVEA